MSADSTRNHRALALVSVASAVGSLDLSLMFVAYPSIKAHFGHESITLVSWVLTSYSIVAGALLIPAGRLADRVGRRKIFVLSLSLFTVGSALCAVAPNVKWLITARVIAACGGALLTPTALAIIMTIFPLERRAWAIGVWSTVSGAIATMRCDEQATISRPSWIFEPLTDCGHEAHSGDCFSLTDASGALPSADQHKGGAEAAGL